MAYVYVWIWSSEDWSGVTWHRRLATGHDAERPSDVPKHAWLAEQDAEAWWDEIMASGRERRWLKPLADKIGDGRRAVWTVTARQLRLALRHYGLRDAVEQAVLASGSPDIADWWEHSTEYDRHHPIVAAMLPALSAVVGREIGESLADDVWAFAETL